MEVRQACQRHLDHLTASRKAEFAWRFDDAKASYACRFIERMPHVKGKWARAILGSSTLITMEPWQLFITCSIFGWVSRSTSLRKYSEIYLEIPRKNAKSTWAAAVGLLMVAADGEYGAEVYCGATTERQAMEVFRTALQMVRRSPEFQRYFGIEFAAKSIYREEDGSRFSVVVGNPGDGSSPSCYIIDEVHEHPTWLLIDTARTGMGAREQGILLMITTAGFNLGGPAYAIRGTLQKILAGQITDESFFGVIFTIDADDDWTDEASLRKANPNFGVSVFAEFLQKELNKALQSAHLQTAFKTKHLNIWGGAAAAWMNMEAWRKCGDPSLQLQDWMGQPCWEGSDLAAKIDLASRIKLYKRLLTNAKTGAKETHYYCFGRHYVPLATAKDGEHTHYDAWVERGLMVAHDATEIQLGFIEEEVIREIPRFNFQCLAFDPYSAQQMQQALAKLIRNGEDVVIDIPQTAPMLSDPMREIEAAVLSGRFHHTGDPVLEWAISNVIAKPAKGEMIYPDKARPENKIDPASALFNAMNRCYTAPVAPQSVYETRGLRTV